jgi:hypothetical protein
MPRKGTRPSLKDLTPALLTELSGYADLDSWLARPMPREQVQALSAAARRHRRLAQLRICHAKRTPEKTISDGRSPLPKGRDWLDVRSSGWAIPRPVAPHDHLAPHSAA